MRRSPCPHQGSRRPCPFGVWVDVAGSCERTGGGAWEWQCSQYLAASQCSYSAVGTALMMGALEVAHRAGAKFLAQLSEGCSRMRLRLNASRAGRPHALCTTQALKPLDEAAQSFWARAQFHPLRGLAAFSKNRSRQAALLETLGQEAAGRLSGAELREVGAFFGGKATSSVAVWVRWL